MIPSTNSFTIKHSPLTIEPYKPTHLKNNLKKKSREEYILSALKLELNASYERCAAATFLAKRPILRDAVFAAITPLLFARESFA